jgi:hypothetical protein
MAENRSRSSWAMNLILMAFSLGFTALVLVGLEFGLRAAGVGAPDASGASELKYQQIYLPVLEPARRSDGTEILHTADQRLPYQTILAEKPAKGLRVITFGGSATAGLGYSPNVTFARHLERMLTAAYPDREVEVLNLGIVALAARQVRVLTGYACEELEPDVVVVYSGNNEFLELHAQKYVAANATFVSRIAAPLRETNLFRALSGATQGEPETPSLAEQDFSQDDLRMTQDAIIADVEVTPEELTDVIAGYGETIDSMVEPCRAGGAEVVLATVAANWEWRGRSDLPEGWLAEAGIDAEGEAALDVLSEKLEASEPKERWEWLFRRAVLAEQLGHFDAARADYRASMNEDPHLRRALDAMADEVRAVARRRGVALLDSIAYLGARAEHGILGFDEFYDYVHFTPRGVVLMAQGFFETMLEDGLLPPTDFDLGGYARARIEALDGLREDALDVGEFMGFGFDPEMLADRDLWKYDHMAKGLDARIEADPGDVRALGYRGNVHFFRLDGAEQAERDYRAALAAGGADPAIQANLDRLAAERPH